MKVLGMLMLVGLLAVPVLAQEKRLPTVDELALANMNLRLRIMLLEYDNIKQQRDRLKARLDRERSMPQKKLVPLREPQEEDAE